MLPKFTRVVHLSISINEEHEQACLFNVRVPFLYGNPYMLFNKKHQKKIQIVWAALSIFIIISMILLYSPIFKLK